MPVRSEQLQCSFQHNYSHMTISFARLHADFPFLFMSGTQKKRWKPEFKQMCVNDFNLYRLFDRNLQLHDV